jgi:hypothetical protein
MPSKRTITIPHYLKRSVSTEGRVVSESDLKLWKNRLNAGRIKYDDIPWPEDGEGFKLTAEQNKKGLDFLLDQWKGKSGKERVNNPFGYREENVLDSFKEFRLIDFYDDVNYYQTQAGIHNYAPYYRVIGKDGDTFEYYYNGGKVNILG